MRIAVGFLFVAGLFVYANGQENPSTNHAVPPPVGLEIGQKVPALMLPD